MQPPFYVGDKIQYVFAPTRSGLPWDLTGATVTITFQDPLGNVNGPYTCTVEYASVVNDQIIPGGIIGIGIYTDMVGVLNSAGLWQRKDTVVFPGGPEKNFVTQFPVLDFRPGI